MTTARELLERLFDAYKTSIILDQVNGPEEWELVQEVERFLNQKEPDDEGWSDWIQCDGKGVCPVPWAKPDEYEYGDDYGYRLHNRQEPEKSNIWAWDDPSQKYRYLLSAAPEGFKP